MPLPDRAAFLRIKGMVERYYQAQGLVRVGKVLEVEGHKDALMPDAWKFVVVSALFGWEIVLLERKGEEGEGRAESPEEGEVRMV